MSHVFSSIASKVQKATEVVKNVGRDAKQQINLAKESLDPSKDYGILWEQNERVEFCRGCDNKFENLVTQRKHHCRSCAGIFCESCSTELPLEGFFLKLIPRTMNPTNFETIRLCTGCRSGECPSQAFKDLIREKLQAEEDARDASVGSPEDALFDKNLDKQFNKFHKKIVGKINEVVGLYDENGPRPLKRLKLAHGSYFGEDGKPSKNLQNRPIPTSGYLEVFNKSPTEVICVKILYTGKGIRFEIPRPSYFAVPPGDTVYAFFDAESESLELMLLFDNPYALPPNKEEIRYNTRGTHTDPETVSKCAQVSEFQSLIIYNIPSQHKNVLLKYKGDGSVIPRQGDGVGRVGILGKLGGLRTGNNKIDYNTNIDSLNYRDTLTTKSLAVESMKR